MGDPLVKRPVVGGPNPAQAGDMHVLPLFTVRKRVAPAHWRMWAAGSRWRSLPGRLWLSLGAVALLGTLLATPPDRTRAELSEAAGRCAAELGARRGAFAEVGGFRLLPSSERQGPRGFEADLRVRWNTAAGPNRGEITTVHCRVTGGTVMLTEAGRTAAPGVVGTRAR